MNVTNDDINSALNNPDIISIMRSAARPYTLLNEDELYTCQVNGLWKCLRWYNRKKIKNGKFTSLLYKAVTWECLSFINFLNKNEYTAKFDLPDKNNERFEELIEHLPEQYKNIIFQRFVMNMTFDEIGKSNGFSGEKARYQYKKAINHLQKMEV